MVEMRLAPLTEPMAPTDDNAIQFKLWKMAHRAYKKQTEAHFHNSYRVFALVLGQWSQALHNRMEASKTWACINDASDMMGLLQLIQNCMIQHQTWQKPIHSLLDAEAQVYGFKQKMVLNNEYNKKFKDLVTNANQLGSDIGVHPEQIETILAGIAANPDMPTATEHEQAQDVAKD